MFRLTWLMSGRNGRKISVEGSRGDCVHWLLNFLVRGGSANGFVLERAETVCKFQARGQARRSHAVTPSRRKPICLCRCQS